MQVNSWTLTLAKGKEPNNKFFDPMGCAERFFWSGAVIGFRLFVRVLFCYWGPW